MRTQADEERVRNNPRITLRGRRRRSRASATTSARSRRRATPARDVATATRRSTASRCTGVSRDYIYFATLRRRARPADQPGRRSTATARSTVLGWDVADKLFGPIDPIDKTITIGGLHFRVVGVSEKKGSVVRQVAGRVRDHPARRVPARCSGRGSRCSSWSSRKTPGAGARRRWTTRRWRCASSGGCGPKEPDNFGMFTSDTLLGIYNTATSGIFAVLIGVVGAVARRRRHRHHEHHADGGQRADARDRAAQGARRAAARHHLADPDRVGHALDVRRHGRHVPRVRPRADHQQAVAAAGRRCSSGRSSSASASPPSSACSSACIRRCGRRSSIRSKPCGASSAAMRPSTCAAGLLREIVVDVVDTLRTNKMRSALTVLGVVIGITSIVGMTSLIRGFDESLRESISELGPEHDLRPEVRRAELRVRGKSFLEVARAPEPDDRRRAARSSATARRWRSSTCGWARRGRQPLAGLLRERAAPSRSACSARPRTSPAVEFRQARSRAVLHRRRSRAPAPGHRARPDAVRSRCSPASIRSARRSAIGVDAVHGHRRAGQAPEPRRLRVGADDFVVIPYTTHEKFYGKVLKGSAKVTAGNIDPARVPHRDDRGGAARRRQREQAMREVEAVMRVRHNLKLDRRTTSTWRRRTRCSRSGSRSARRTFLALVVISSIALMVGGIGVMAIMMISVTERTREIGVRKALGARRREILWQFLIEAVFLTSMGGLLGILFGSAIGLLRPLADRLPGLAALVVVRARHRLLRQRRDLLRDVPGVQGLAAGSDRSAAIRVAFSFQLSAPSSQLPAPSFRAS